MFAGGLDSREPWQGEWEDGAMVRCKGEECIWSGYSVWSECGVSCGVGRQVRKRRILQPAGEGGEEMMLFVRGDNVVGISKVNSYDCDFKGEGVGFFKLAANDCHKLKNILEEFEQAGKVNVEYEDSLHELLSHCTAGFESVDDLPWIEIDFEEDIERAGREILPKIENVDRN